MQQKYLNLTDKKDIKPFFELDLIKNAMMKNYYSEKLKIGSKIYFFGGMDIKGKITDEIMVYHISLEKFEKIESTLPLKLYYFSIVQDEANNNKMYIVGGYKDKFDINQKVYSLDLENNSCIFYYNIVKSKEICDLKTSRLRPIILMKEKHLFIFGGFKVNNDYMLQILRFNDNNLKITPGLFRNEFKITKSNLAMLSYVSS